MKMNVNNPKPRRSGRETKVPGWIQIDRQKIKNAENELARKKKELARKKRDKREAGKNVTMTNMEVEKAKRKLKKVKKEVQKRGGQGKMQARNLNRNRSPYRGNYYTGLNRQRSYNHRKRRVPNRNAYMGNMGHMMLSPNQQQQLAIYTNGFSRCLAGNVFTAGPSRRRNRNSNSNSNSNRNSNRNMNSQTSRASVNSLNLNLGQMGMCR